MRRKVSQAYLNASHRKKFENHCLKSSTLCRVFCNRSIIIVAKVPECKFVWITCLFAAARCNYPANLNFNEPRVPYVMFAIRSRRNISQSLSLAVTRHLSDCTSIEIWSNRYAIQWNFYAIRIPENRLLW